MRIVVIGTSGAGKTTLARRIAVRLNLPHIELDAINWQAGWRDLDRHDRDEFRRRVTAAIQPMPGCSTAVTVRCAMHSSAVRHTWSGSTTNAE
jgi:adenylate kinase family enzyme